MFKRILVPVDLEEPNFADSALEFAIREARQSESELHLMTVMPGYHMPLVASYFPAQARDQAAKVLASHLKAYAADKVPADINVKLWVSEGNPSDQILKKAKSIDAWLIILAAHHRSKMDQVLMGSTSAKVADHASCSVMVLRQ